MNLPWIRADHYIQMIFRKSMTGWISSCPTVVLWLQPMLLIHLFLFTCYIMNALLCSPTSLAEGMKTKFPLSKCLHRGCCRRFGLENFGLASVCLGHEGREYIPSKSERLWEVYLTPNNHSNQDKNSWNCNLQMTLFPVPPCTGVMQLRRITWRRKTMANLNRDHQVKSTHNSWNQNELIFCRNVVPLVVSPWLWQRWNGQVLAPLCFDILKRNLILTGVIASCTTVKYDWSLQASSEKAVTDVTNCTSKLM